MGTFNTHGGYFAPPGLMKIEAGGSHESNPNGGVSVGVDPNGVPNMVEEGETIYKDFVFSDNITADASILKEANIPAKYEGKLYSEIADDLIDSAEENPNDAIANNTINAMLARLAEAQETQKQQEEQRQLEEELSKLSPEELAELEAMLEQGAAEEQQAIVPEQMQAPMPMQEQMPMMQEPQMFETGGPKDTLRVDPSLFNERGQIILKGLPPTLGMPGASTVSNGARLSERGLKALEGVKKKEKLVTWLKNLPFMTSKEEAARLGTTAAKAVVDAAPTVEPVAAEAASVSNRVAKNIAHPWRRWLAGHPNALNDAYGKDWGWFKKGATWMLSPTTAAVNYGLDKGIPAAYNALTDDEFAALKDVQQEEPNDSVKYDFKAWGFGEGGKKLPVFPRYAGALTSGAVGLYDAFQKPDSYTYTPIRPRMSSASFNYVDPVYNPIDSNRAVGSLLSSSAGASRGMMNSGLGPSTASALIAADYNTGRNMGNVYSQIGEYNTNLYNNVLAQRNANRQAASQLGLYRDNYNNQLAYQAALNDRNEDIRRQMYYQNSESQKYAALQNQIDQVAQALSDIGKENVAFNWANSDEAYDYVMNLLGQAYKRACGGKLRK